MRVIQCHARVMPLSLQGQAHGLAMIETLLHIGQFPAIFFAIFSGSYIVSETQWLVISELLYTALVGPL